MDTTNATAYYLEKENTGKRYPSRFTMGYWENDKSYRFLKSKRKHLVSPVADFGCGHGPLSILTSRLGLSVTAFDCIEDNIRNGNRLKGPDDTVEFVQCFLSDIPVPDNSFASGVCKEVLEHIIAPELPKVLSEIKRVMRPGGVVVFTVPRETILNSMAPLEHVNFFETPDRLAKYLKKNDFKIIKKEFNRIYRRICIIAKTPEV